MARMPGRERTRPVPPDSSPSKTTSSASSYGPTPDIRRKLRMLAIPALAVLLLGVVLMGWYYSLPRVDRSDALYYSATIAIFVPLVILLPVVKIYILWPAGKGRGKG